MKARANEPEKQNIFVDIINRKQRDLLLLRTEMSVYRTRETHKHTVSYVAGKDDRTTLWSCSTISVEKQ